MKKIFLISIIILYTTICWSAPLKNAKIQIKQPNGKIIDCFATGDEYYHWAHDKDNFTIVQDQKTGYYCYAINQNDELTASKFVVGVDNPSKSGLQPGINLSSDKIFSIKSQILSTITEEPELVTKSTQPQLKSVLTAQTLNNIVVYVRFADQSEFPANQSFYTSLCNSSTSGANSMYNYFREASFNNLNIISNFFPTNNGTNIISYQDSHIRNYYCPKTALNDSGYTYSGMYATRQEILLVNAVNYIKNQIPVSLNIDYNNDGYVDDFCFIIRGPADNGNLLWPHESVMVPIYINSKQTNCYNIQFENVLNNSGSYVLYHEMFHTLGARDLYNYGIDWYPIVYEWDIMSSFIDPPPSMCAYGKYKFGHWISSIPEITQSGHYTLNPITSISNNCYRISSSNPFEYFVLEFRKKSGTFESSIPGTGLIIYRINSNNAVNYYDPPYEVYVFRKDGSPGVAIANWGDINNAYFDSSVGRSTFHNTSNPYCFLSDGTLGNVYIKNIVVSGNTVSFDVRFCNGNDIAYSNTNQLPQFTNAINKIETSASVTVKSTDNISFEAGQEILLNGFEVQLGGQFLININGCGNQ